MARASAFQAEGRGFESRLPLAGGLEAASQAFTCRMPRNIGLALVAQW